MSEFVFILGAGASVNTGAPLMKNFFDVTEDLLKAGAFNATDTELIEKTFKCIAYLQAIYAKSYIDLDNLEQVFGLIEMGCLLQQKNNNDNTYFTEYRESIVRLIVRTLEESIKTISLSPIRFSGEYGGYVNNVFSKIGYNKISVITFNYDIVLDYYLIQAGVKFDYALEGNEGGATDSLKLLKLHGSLNWAISGNEIIPFIEQNQEFAVNQIADNNYANLLITSSLIKGSKKIYKGIEYVISQENPFIVPPTWNKTHHNPKIANVWKQAATELQDASYIIIAGYSLPETDSFFKYLLSLGTLSPKRIRKILVINTDEKVKDNYQKIFGKGVENRFQFEKRGFDSLVGCMRDAGIIKF